MDDWKTLPAPTLEALEAGLPPLEDIHGFSSERDEKLAALLHALDLAPSSQH